jgi:phosphomannomutase
LDWPVVRREDIDGIKLYLGDIGWVMVRSSGTERMLRIYAETTQAETTQKILSGVSEFVHSL